MKRFLYLIVVASVMACMFLSCNKHDSNPDGTETGIYVSIIGFNDKITKFNCVSGKGKNTKEYKFLRMNGSYLEEGSNKYYWSSGYFFEWFINDLETSNGTKLYHAVRVAIDELKSQAFPDNLKNVSIVTFTDGLDLGSYGDSEYGSSAEYLNAINNRIMTEKIQGIGIDAYTVGVKGSDVNDTEKFHSDLVKLSSSEENAMIVSSMSEVMSMFSEIAKSLYNRNVSQSLSLTIPLPERDQRIRFTFDVSGTTPEAAENSQMYIDCQFSSKSELYIKNLNYVGITAGSRTISGSTDDHYHIKYNFSGICGLDGNPIPTTNVKEWYSDSNGQWQINSEFDGDDNVNVTKEERSAAIMLVLDCSSSLGDDFNDMKQAAKDFIDHLNISSQY
ncbi:MAG: hypothetical protein IKP45_03655 [Bacteroidales bacterium]|nr:hypothetical protein [Bacteroidales bacterium]